MRQIINIQVGQCGNRVGNTFWKQAMEQHGINNLSDNKQKKIEDNNLEFPEVYFSERKNGQYYSRSVLADLDCNTLDKIAASDMRNIFRQQNMISGKNGSSNLFAKGRYTYGLQLQDTLVDSIRRQVENCQKVQGFHFLHSTAGGTGSGLGSILLQNISNYYPQPIVQSASVFPSVKKNSDCTIQIYNSCFSISRLVEYASQTLIYDNLSLQNISFKQKKVSKPTFQDYNKLIASSILGTTAASRFHGQLTSSLRKISTNLIPFPRLHFLSVSHQRQTSLLYPQKQIIRQSMHNSSIMCNLDLSSGRYFAISANFMSKVPLNTSAIEENLLKIRELNSNKYIEWIPDHFQISYSKNQRIKQKIQSTFLLNNSAIKSIFNQFSQTFTAMFRRKSYVHWYTSQGMDEMQFTQAESNLNDLVSEYPYNYQNQYQDQLYVEE